MKKKRGISELALIVFLVFAVGASIYLFTRSISGGNKGDEVSEKVLEEDTSESLADDPPQISSEGLRDLIENNQNVTVINPESRENFFKKHIPGSISFPNDEIAANLPDLPRDHTIVVTSSGSEMGCNLSLRIARLLVSEGYPDVRDHHDGWAGWEKKGFPVVTDNSIDVPQISVSDLNEMILDRQEVEIIDLRSEVDFSKGHIQSALNIPYYDLANQKNNIPHNKLVIVYDQDGTKSDLIGTDLLENKYVTVKSLVGGYDKWRLQID